MVMLPQIFGLLGVNFIQHSKIFSTNIFSTRHFQLWWELVNERWTYARWSDRADISRKIDADGSLVESER